MTPADRAAYIAGLRRLADAIERSDAVPVPHSASALTLMLYEAQETPDGLAAAVRELGGTDWEQELTTGSTVYLYVRTDLGGGFKVQIMARADAVCESVQTGMAPVYERKCPALDAVIAEAGTGGAS